MQYEMKQSTTIRADEVDIKKWERAANVSGLSYSEWARRALNEAADGRRKIEPEEYLGGTDAVQQHAREMAKEYEVVPEPAVESKRSLPRARPAQRKHIDVREDVEEKPGKKCRCKYLWPSNSKKCPRCSQVHSDV